MILERRRIFGKFHLKLTAEELSLGLNDLFEKGPASALHAAEDRSRERYWLAQGLNGFATTDIPGEIWSSAHDQPGARGLLQLYLQGPSSEHASKMSEEQRILYAIEQVERVFRGLRTHLESASSPCWDNDQWAGGATRLMNVGQVTAFHNESRAPEGHIHFAGEHTSTWFARMNGAIESGSRAACEVNGA